MPKTYALAASNFEKFFRQDPTTGKFVFAKIGGLKHYPLEKLLTEKYRYKQDEALLLADFLMQMLKWFPTSRSSAK